MTKRGPSPKRREPSSPFVALVTGASSGIGAAAAASLVARGYRVYGLSRSGRAPEGVIPLACDVTDADAFASAVSQLLRREGHLDAALLAAGFGVAGAAEFLPPEDAERQYGVNLLAVSSALTVLTSPLRESRGRLLAVSSVAAVFPIPYQAHYSSTKAGLNALIRAYATEVAPFGISAGAVMLGDVRTGFTAARKTTLAGDALYGGRIERGIAAMERDEEGGADPGRIGDALSRLLSRRRLPRLSTVGLSYRLLVFLSRLLPVSFADFVVSRLYR